MSMFGKKKDRSNMLKFGPFYYPKSFYELADSHLLGRPLKQHFEISRGTENYEYLMRIRKLGLMEMRPFLNEFVLTTAPKMINVSATARNTTIANVNAMFQQDPRQRFTGFSPKKLKDAFSQATTEVMNLAEMDLIGEDKAGKFWKSEMFLAVHGWRMKRFWRKWQSASKVPVDRLSDAAFARATQALEEGGNNANIADLGVTEDEWADFLDFSNVGND